MYFSYYFSFSDDDDDEADDSFKVCEPFLKCKWWTFKNLFKDQRLFKCVTFAKNHVLFSNFDLFENFTNS